MQDIKTLFTTSNTRDDITCDDLFECLVSQIRKLPEEKRGVEALRLTAHLLEFAAFELAATLGSEKAGALIECAAQLSEHTEIGETSLCCDEQGRRRVIQ